MRSFFWRLSKARATWIIVSSSGHRNPETKGRMGQIRFWLITSAPSIFRALPATVLCARYPGRAFILRHAELTDEVF